MSRNVTGRYWTKFFCLSWKMYNVSSAKFVVVYYVRSVINKVVDYNNISLPQPSYTVSTICKKSTTEPNIWRTQ